MSNTTLARAADTPPERGPEVPRRAGRRPRPSPRRLDALYRQKRQLSERLEGVNADIHREVGLLLGLAA
jgi:hypothetical protein